MLPGWHEAVQTTARMNPIDPRHAQAFSLHLIRARRVLREEYMTSSPHLAKRFEIASANIALSSSMSRFAASFIEVAGVLLICLVPPLLLLSMKTLWL